MKNLLKTGEVYLKKQYLRGLQQDNTMLKKSFLGTTLCFLIMVWVVLPSNEIAQLPDIGPDPDPGGWVDPPPPKPIKPTTVTVPVDRAPIPDPTPDEPEVESEYIYFEEERTDPLADEGWTMMEVGERVGIVGVNVDQPDCYHKELPVYPDLAVKAKITGVVILNVEWDTNGNITRAKVLSSPGKQFGFDKAAVDAVKQWKCHPATIGKRKVRVRGTVTVNFRLN